MTKQLPRIIVKFLSCLLKLLGKGRRQKILASLSGSFSPIIEITTDKGEICVQCSSRRSLYWAKNFLTHEPETIKWISSFSSGDIFWDIGANVGIYSLFASLNKGVRVISFEPMSESFASLQKNIYLNNKSDSIESFCLSLSESKSISSLSLNNTESGSDSHVFIKNKNSLSGYSNIQTILSISVDEFITEFKPAFPAHIKIDVDGPEIEVLEGAQQTLRDKRLVSILIEGDVEDSEKNTQLFSLIEEAGFILASKGSTANSKIHCNYLFKR